MDNKNLFENYQDYKIDQLSSFDKETLMKHSYMHPSFVKLIQEIDIPTLSMNDLLEKYKVKKIDLLQIDTEGYDFEILQTFDFNKISPTIIIYEHQHLKLTDYKTLIIKFRKSGYKSFKCNWDTVCIKE
jgi:FkbM family methyltransferase